MFAQHGPSDAQRHLYSRHFFLETFACKQKVFLMLLRPRVRRGKDFQRKWQSKSRIPRFAERPRTLAVRVHELSTLLPFRRKQLILNETLDVLHKIVRT